MLGFARIIPLQIFTLISEKRRQGKKSATAQQVIGSFPAGCVEQSGVCNAVDSKCIIYIYIYIVLSDHSAVMAAPLRFPRAEGG